MGAPMHGGPMMGGKDNVRMCEFFNTPRGEAKTLFWLKEEKGKKERRGKTKKKKEEEKEGDEEDEDKEDDEEDEDEDGDEDEEKLHEIKDMVVLWYECVKFHTHTHTHSHTHLGFIFSFPALPKMFIL